MTLLYTIDNNRLSGVTLLVTVIVHQCYYFYGQSLLGLAAYKLYAFASILYSLGRHAITCLLLYTVSDDLHQSLLWSALSLLVMLLPIRIKAKKYLGNSQIPITGLPDVIKNMSYARGIFFGSIAASAMASIDRLIASNVFNSSIAGQYVTVFIFASVISLIPQPVYRLFFTRFSKFVFLGDVRLLRDLCFTATVVTSVSSFVGLILIRYTEFFGNVWLGGFSSLQIELAQILTIIFCFVSIGWMPATVLQAQGLQVIQTIAISLALVAGLSLLYLYFDKEEPLLMMLTWGCHAVFQTLFIP